MTAKFPRQLTSRLTAGATRAVVPSAAALALAAGLAGCKGVAVTSSAAGSSLTTTAASAPGASSAAPAAGGAATDGATPAGSDLATASPSEAQGPGSISTSVTSPVTVAGSVMVPVSCVAGLAYRATVTSAVVQGDQLSFSVAIPRYRGPGSYPAVVGATLRQASGVVTTVAGVSRIPTAITSTGGSFSVSATGSDGRTLTGSLNWTCGT
jgi:hypothetical protein